MDKMLNVVIVMARCSKKEGAYGIRIEEKDKGHWVADWAFQTNESVAKREGYDKGEIRGRFSLSGEFPGCPYCGNSDILQCSCGKIFCWDGKTKTNTCPWCGSAGDVGDKVIESVSFGEDR